MSKYINLYERYARSKAKGPVDRVCSIYRNTSQKKSYRNDRDAWVAYLDAVRRPGYQEKDAPFGYYHCKNRAYGQDPCYYWHLGHARFEDQVVSSRAPFLRVVVPVQFSRITSKLKKGVK